MVFKRKKMFISKKNWQTGRVNELKMARHTYLYHTKKHILLFVIHICFLIISPANNRSNSRDNPGKTWLREVCELKDALRDYRPMALVQSCPVGWWHIPSFILINKVLLHILIILYFMEYFFIHFPIDYFI